MSVFKLPVWVMETIDRIRRGFLWKKNSNEDKGISLANWELVCKPKKFGGLGVIDIQLFNDALLLKWYWYWCQPELRLWKSVILISHRTRRKSDVPSCQFFTNTLKKAIIFGDNNMIWEIGDGSNIRFWQQNWGFGILKYKFPDIFALTNDPAISVQEAFQTQCAEEIFTELDLDLFGDQVEQLQTILDSIQLIPSTQDRAK